MNPRAVRANERAVSRLALYALRYAPHDAALPQVGLEAAHYVQILYWTERYFELMETYSSAVPQEARHVGFGRVVISVRKGLPRAAPGIRQRQLVRQPHEEWQQ